MSGALKLASGALLGAGLVQGFKALYNAADESRRISALTGAVIKSTGGAAGVSAKQVGDLAAAIAKKTGMDDEAIQSGENLLLTFTNIKNAAGKGNDIFNQTTKIMTDMSVALGQDATTSAKQLGKALNDPIKGITALSKAGVSFTQQQKDQIRTLVESGDVMGAQKIILAELGKEFGGAAEAAATPLGKLQQRVGDLAEQIGGYLLPVVDSAATFFSDKLLPALSNVGSVVGTGVGPAFKAVVTVVGAVATAFNALPGPLQTVVVGLGLFAALKGPVAGVLETIGLKALYMKDAISGAAGGIGGFKGAMSTLAGAFTPVNVGIGAALALLPALVSTFKALTGNSDLAAAGQRTLADALRDTNGVIDDNARAAAQQTLISEGLVDVLEKAGVSSRDAIGGLLGEAGARDRVIKALQAQTLETMKAQGPVNTNSAAVSEAQQKYEQLAESLGMTKQEAKFFADSAKGAAGATGDAADATADLTAAAEENRDAMSEAKQAIDDYKLSLDILTGNSVSMIQVESALNNAIDAGAKAMDNLGGSVLDSSGKLNLQSENGRKAADVLLDVRNSGNQLIATMQQQGATADQVSARDAQLRASFIRTANQMGITGGNADRLADQILGIPGSRTTTINANTGAAVNGVNAVKNAIQALRDRTINVTTTYINRYIDNQVAFRRAGGASGGKIGNLVRGFAGGGSPRRQADGHLIGPGGPLDDLIPAITNTGERIQVANDEWIINGAVSARMGDRKMAALNAGQADIVPRRFRRGGTPGDRDGAGMARGGDLHVHIAGSFDLASSRDLDRAAMAIYTKFKQIERSLS